MDSYVTSSSSKSSSDLDQSFLNKRDLKFLQKNLHPVLPDMSMIFTPLVKVPKTASTKSCSSNDEPRNKKPQPSIFSLAKNLA